MKNPESEYLQNQPKTGFLGTKNGKSEYLRQEQKNRIYMDKKSKNGK
ncbi:MAG: hypothetical protein QNJ47_03375 [Nostocaceae cyanobacterium]|nr:hypothetical protein [Nostocaceae cyanobacterium]